VRRLLPEPSDEVDLAAAYAVSAPGSRHVRANMVASADGSAQRDGRSAGLSEPADRTVFHVLRGLTDVVLAGAGTVRTERYGPARPRGEPRAARREAGLPEAPPVAVVTASLDFDLSSPFFAEAEVRPIVLTCDRAPAGRRRAAEPFADVVVAGDARVDLPAALDALAERGLARVLCEGGPTLLAELVAVRRLDELCLSISPQLVGGPPTRILDGAGVDPPARLELTDLLAEDSLLLARYTLR
jgi:riboflavin biosynthesis pyrimidine reductase